MTQIRRTFRLALPAALLAVSVLVLQPASATLPPTSWIPDSLIIPPVPSGTRSIHITRRIVPQQHLPGRFLLGHALYGLWQDAPGYGWTPLMPNCLGLGTGSLIAGTVPGCGVEGIAMDESGGVNAALTAYISTFNIDILGGTGRIDPGGVWKAQLPRVGSTALGSAGVVWKQILPGIRGNALLVRRRGTSNTIVAGRIQQNSVSTGIDNNGFCGLTCNPSVYVSHDDGVSWSPKTFTGSTCTEAVPTSSRLVSGLAADPANQNVMYAAANSGLWASLDNGETWLYEFNSCGNAPGFAITPHASRMYVGQNTSTGTTSSLFGTTRDAGGPAPWTQLLNAQTFAPIVFDGWVQQIIIDSRDTSDRTMFVATWRNAGVTGGGLGGIYKVKDLGNGTATVTNLRASFLTNVPNPTPYPFTFSTWSPSLFLAQHPLAPDLIYASSVYGGVWVRSDEDSTP